MWLMEMATDFLEVEALHTRRILRFWSGRYLHRMRGSGLCDYGMDC